MSNIMTDNLIKDFLEDVEDKKIAFERIALKRNHLNRRQLILTNLLDSELIKYKKAGFTFAYGEDDIVLSCFSEEMDTFDFSVKSFTIDFKERNLKYTFTPEVNGAGTIKYKYLRIEGGNSSYCNELIWDMEKKAWYFKADGHKLQAMLFDSHCVIMILTNMRYL